MQLIVYFYAAKRERNIYTILAILIHRNSFWQDNLDSTMRIWNNHIIRRTNRGLPHGRPDVMCEAPYLYGTRSFLVPVTSEEVSACDPICVFRSSIVCDADIYRLCCIIMGENNLIYPKTPEEGFQLYFSLRRHLRVSLQL